MLVLSRRKGQKIIERRIWTPTGELFDEKDTWITRQMKWIKKFDKRFNYPVTINPILLYLGVAFGILGIMLS